MISEPDDIDALLSSGPSTAVQVWKARTSRVLDDIPPPMVKYFSLPLQNIWTARNITPSREDGPASAWILDQVNGADDTCVLLYHVTPQL
jgi:hypothetical protein